MCSYKYTKDWDFGQKICFGLTTSTLYNGKSTVFLTNIKNKTYIPNLSTLLFNNVLEVLAIVIR